MSVEMSLCILLQHRPSLALENLTTGDIARSHPLIGCLVDARVRHALPELHTYENGTIKARQTSAPHSATTSAISADIVLVDSGYNISDCGCVHSTIGL